METQRLCESKVRNLHSAAVAWLKGTDAGGTSAAERIPKPWFWRRSFLPFFRRRKKGSRRRHGRTRWYYGLPRPVYEPASQGVRHRTGRRGEGAPPYGGQENSCCPGLGRPGGRRHCIPGGQYARPPGYKKRTDRPVRSLSERLCQRGHPHRGVTTYFPPFPQSPGSPPPGSPFHRPGWRCR